MLSTMNLLPPERVTMFCTRPRLLYSASIAPAETTNCSTESELISAELEPNAPRVTSVTSKPSM